MLVRMIAVDMDGTLLGADGQVSARNLAALKAAEAAGVEVVVATGRRHCYAMRQLQGAGAGGGECADQLEWDGGADDWGEVAGADAAADGDGAVALWACGGVQEFAGDDVRQGGAGWGG